MLNCETAARKKTVRSAGVCERSNERDALTEDSTKAPLGPLQKNESLLSSLHRFLQFVSELHTAVKKKNLDRVKQLLDGGFSVNVKDNFGWTPLHESLNDDPRSIKIMKVRNKALSQLQYLPYLVTAQQVSVSPVVLVTGQRCRARRCFILDERGTGRSWLRNLLSPFGLTPASFVYFLSQGVCNQ